MSEIFALFRQIWAESLKVWENSTSGTRIILITTTAVVFVCLVAVLVIAGRPQYEFLYGGLAPDQASEVISYLKEQNIPYKTGAGGGTILVPKNYSDQVRMEVFTTGTLTSGGPGFELFDTPKLGMTNRLYDINFKRALQGRLEKTLSSSPQVLSARVDISIPQNDLFTDSDEKPTAGITLNLRGKLKEKNIIAIASLVAAGVGEGLQPEDVTIIDINFNPLNEFMRASESIGLSGDQLEFILYKENDLETKAVDMLASAVGRNNVNVKVTLDLDFDKIEKHIETFDPDGTVTRSQKTTTEEITGEGGAAGSVPGVAANVVDAGSPTAGGSSGTGSKKEFNEEILNNEISSIREHQIKAPGSIKKMSVSVLVNGKYNVNESGEKEYVPRSSDDLLTIEKLVKGAVGYDQLRDGPDAIQVASFQFDETDKIRYDEFVKKEQKQALLDKVFPLIIGILGVGVLMAMIFWMLKRGLKAPIPEMMIIEEEAFEEEVPEIGKALSLKELGIRSVSDISNLPAEEQRRLKLQEYVGKFALDHPEEVAQIIKSWMAD